MMNKYSIFLREMLTDKFSFSRYIGLRILWITAKPVLLLVKLAARTRWMPVIIQRLVSNISVHKVFIKQKKENESYGFGEGFHDARRGGDDI